MIFNKYRLEDITDKIGDGIHGTPEYDDNGDYYFVNGNNLVDGDIVLKKDTKRINEEQYLKNKRDLNKNTLLVSINGTLGNVAKYNNEKIILGKSACYMNVKDEYNVDYVYFVFESPEFKKYLQYGANGTTIKNVPLSAIRNYEISIPSKENQDKIVRILKSIEDKIKLNNKINNNLYDEMQVLYNEWFKEFNPFKNNPFKDTILGKIPERFTVEDIYSISNVIYGAPFKSNLFNEEKNGKPIIRIRDLKNQNMKTYTPENHPKGYLLQKGDITVGMDGEFRPYFWGNDEAWLNQRVCVFENKRKKGKAFLYYTLKPLLDFIEKTEVATTVIHIGKNDFDEFKIILPDEDTLDKFDEITNPMVWQIVQNMIQNHRLEKLRDTLLPKLMNGEIDLDNIEI